MRLLLLSPFPYAASSGQGGATACANALDELAKDHELAALCFCDGSDAEARAEAEMARKVSLLRTLPLRVTKPRVLRAKLMSLFGDTPEHAVYFRSPEFAEAARRMVGEFRPDAVMCQFPQMAQYLPLFDGIPTVHDVQDAFCVSGYRRAVSSPPGWRRRYAFRQWRNWLAYESRLYPLASQCWTVSEQDRYGLTAYVPQLNVVTLERPLLEGPFELPPSGGASATVGFLGAFSHGPNVEALAYLLRDIVPALVQRHPEVRVLIAGRNPPAELVASAPAEVRFLGFVESVREFYDQCAVVVAPLLSGGGMKIKVAEALCHRKAIVATTIGAEGLPLVDGRDILIADRPGPFVERVSRLLTDPALRERIELAAFECAQVACSRDRWRAHAGQLLGELAGSQRAGRT